MNVPKLRFKEFTDEWQEHKLKDFTVPVKRKNTNNESDLPLTISSLDGLVDQRTYFNKVVASKDMSNYYLLKKGEFAYNKSYSVGFPFGSIKRLDKYNQGALSSLYICFQVNNMNSDFTVKYFESPKWHKQISLCVAEGARNHGLLNVNINDFFSTKHFFPQLKEQQKIANFLSTVDKKISNLEDIVTNLENQKKGLLQQIFNQGIRFKDENGNNYPDWEKKKLGDTLLIQRGGSPRPISDYITNDKNGLNWIKIGDCSPNSNIITSTKEKIKPEGLSKTREVFIGDLILSNSMSFGRPYILNINGCIHDGWLLLRNTQKIYNLQFLCYILGSEYTTKQYKKLAAGSTVNNLNIELVSSVNIDIPCLEEQTKIADFLSAFDRKIDNQKAQLEHWKQIKKGLLQQIFV